MTEIPARDSRFPQFRHKHLAAGDGAKRRQLVCVQDAITEGGAYQELLFRSSDLYVNVAASSSPRGGLQVNARAERTPDATTPLPDVAVTTHFPDIHFPPTAEQYTEYVKALTATGNVALFGATQFTPMPTWDVGRYDR